MGIGTLRNAGGFEWQLTHSRRRNASTSQSGPLPSGAPPMPGSPPASAEPPFGPDPPSEVEPAVPPEPAESPEPPLPAVVLALPAAPVGLPALPPVAQEPGGWVPGSPWMILPQDSSSGAEIHHPKR